MGCISRINLCPASGDTENVLLQKILQSLNEGAGGAGGAVSSVNGQTGAVMLTTDDVPEGGSNLYFTDARAIAAVSASGAYLLKAGDTGTGAFFFTPTAANVTPLTLTNSLTGASLVPTLEINPTWNTTGAPTALKVNVLSTASAAAANIFDFQLGSTPVFHLRKDGRLTLAGRAAFNTTSGIGHAFAVNDALSASSVVVLSLQHVLSAGTAAAGMGIIIDQNIDSTTTANTRAARWVTSWTDATHATRTAQTLFQSFVSGVDTISMILANGQVQGNPGTVTVPSFTNRNDTNTGMYFSAADTIAFTGGGVAQATLGGGILDLLGGLLTAGNATIAGAITAASGTITQLDTTDLLFNGGDFEFFSPATGSIVFGDGSLGAPVAIDFGGTTSSFSSFRFVGTEIQFKLADNSAFSDARLNHLFLANGTAPGGDPTTSAEQWAASGEWQYRTSTASEGSGQTNRVHNRGQEVIGAGTDYTLTAALAKVDFGTTDPEVVLPTAGTYLITGHVQFNSSALSTNDSHITTLRNVTDSVYIESLT